MAEGDALVLVPRQRCPVPLMMQRTGSQPLANDRVAVDQNQLEQPLARKRVPAQIVVAGERLHEMEVRVAHLGARRNTQVADRGLLAPVALEELLIPAVLAIAASRFQESD